MSRRAHTVPPSEAAHLATQRMRVAAGEALRAARARRRWTLRRLGEAAGVSIGTAHAAENGGVVTIEVIARLGVALGLRPELSLPDARQRTAPVMPRAEDPVHAAMGEMEAAHLRPLGFPVSLDEPYQHYHFAGRADLVAWQLDPPALLHSENRTRFPNVQESLGSYNAKRTYLAGSLAAHLGIRSWASVTHVMVVLASAEALHTIRIRRATFESICPDPDEAFLAWWAGTPPSSGTTSSMVFMDPAASSSSDKSFVPLAQSDTLRPRYRDYAAALDALRRLGRA